MWLGEDHEERGLGRNRGDLVSGTGAASCCLSCLPSPPHISSQSLVRQETLGISRIEHSQGQACFTGHRGRDLGRQPDPWESRQREGKPLFSVIVLAAGVCQGKG